MRKTVVELDSSARDPWMILAPNLKWGIFGEHVAGLRELLLAAEDRARHDQRLRPRPAFGQSSAHEQLVCTDPG